MRLALRDRRDEAVKRHDRAFELDPSRTTQAFRDALQSVVADLESIIERSPRADSDPVELAKTHRCAGQAYDDLARSGFRESIPLAIGHYEAALQLLNRTGADIERAKVDANYANTLCQQAAGTNVPLMEEADSRYEAALRVFEAHKLNAFAEQVREYRRVLEGQLVLARKAAHMRGELSRLDEISQRLKHADSYESQELLQQALQVINGGANVGGMVDDAVKQASELTEKYKTQHPELKDRMASLLGLQEKLSEASAQVSQHAKDFEPGSETNFEMVTLAALSARLAKEFKEGSVPAGKAAAFENLVKRIGRVLSSGDSLSDVRKRVSEIHDLMAEVNEFAEGRLQDDLAKLGPIARRVYGGLSRAHVKITNAAAEGTEERQVRHQIFQDMLDLLSELHRKGLTEQAALDVEPTAWGLALKAQEFWRRQHVLVVEPLWDCPTVQVRPKRFFVAGKSLMPLVQAVATRMRAEVLPVLPEHAIAQGRWDQLRSCGVALFEFGEGGLDEAQTAYELGMALVLGVPSAIFAPDGATIPFDIDLPAHRLGGTEADVELVEHAVASAVFLPARAGQVEVPATMAQQTLLQFKERYGPLLPNSYRSVALRMVEEASNDPYAFARTMEAVLKDARLSKPQVVRPAWPQKIILVGGDKPVVFHVTPFAQEFDEQEKSAMRACESSGYQYVRHDMTKDARIIWSLWGWILSADRIVVDITNANPNVALELGLAHAVGKELLLMARIPVKQHMFPSLLHVKVTGYTRDDDSFAEAITKWLS